MCAHMYRRIIMVLYVIVQQGTCERTSVYVCQLIVCIMLLIDGLSLKVHTPPLVNITWQYSDDAEAMHASVLLVYTMLSTM